jgi:hypothetical protein
VELYLETHILLIAAFLIIGKISPLKIGGNIEKAGTTNFSTTLTTLKQYPVFQSSKLEVSFPVTWACVTK